MQTRCHYLRVFAMLWTKNSQPLAICTVARIVEIAEHIVAFDFRLENRAERCLTLVFVETTLHMANGIPYCQSDTAGYALHSSGFHLSFPRFFVIAVIRINCKTLSLGYYFLQIL